MKEHTMYARYEDIDVYNTSLGTSPLLSFRQTIEFAKFRYVKTKAFSNAFYMYVPCPLSTPGAFCRCMTMQMYKFILRILLVGHENDYIYISISQSCLRNVDSFHLQHL